MQILKRCFILALTILLFSSVSANAIGVAFRIHNEQGERVGTCKRDGNNVYCLYDMNGKKVQNPAKFMKQDADDCYLFDYDGLAIGKCTSKRIILWGRGNNP